MGHTSGLFLSLGDVLEAEVGGSCILLCLLLLCEVVGAGEASVGLFEGKKTFCESGGGAPCDWEGHCEWFNGP